MNKLDESIRQTITRFYGDEKYSTIQAVAAIKQAIIDSLPEYKGSEPNIAGSLLEEGYNQAIEDIKKLLQ